MTKPTTHPRYINRELSWLAFNRRVLDLARPGAFPLLERLKFLAISDSNLNEFFMVRVGGLHLVRLRAPRRRDLCGFTSNQQLDMIRSDVRAMIQDQYKVFWTDIEPAMRDAGLMMVTRDSITEQQRNFIYHRFDEEIASIVSPVGIPSRGDMPLIQNLKIHLILRLRSRAHRRQTRYCIVPILPPLERFVFLPCDTGKAFICMEDLIAVCAERLFPQEEIDEISTFRVTRNADMRVQEDEANDLMEGMEQVLTARKVSNCVRLEVEKRASRAMTDFLKRRLKADARDVYRIDRVAALGDMMDLACLEAFDHLRLPPWIPVYPPALKKKRNMFDQIADQDLMLCHPFDSFEPIVKLVSEAAEDPQVLAIKVTLYRVSSNSPIVEALRTAARNGKYVTALVELKARFDEARNIAWARDLELDGAQVLYGVRGLKTHSKIMMIVRKEKSGTVRYMHFGTGNYNEKTAALYTDMSLLTCDATLGTDASRFFNAVSGTSEIQPMEKLTAAPHYIREKLLDLIDHEIERCKQGQKARIIGKVNSLSDQAIIDALYKASMAGVDIRLNVRGICRLRPGVKGLSDNITVVSIVDRFLEHSRAFYFYHGGEELVFISSADWMGRNLDKRVELLIPIEAPDTKRYCVDILKQCIKDSAAGRKLQSDGSYTEGKRGKCSCQTQLCDDSQLLARKAAATPPSKFEPQQSGASR